MYKIIVYMMMYIYVSMFINLVIIIECLINFLIIVLKLMWFFYIKLRRRNFNYEMGVNYMYENLWLYVWEDLFFIIIN